MRKVFHFHNGKEGGVFSVLKNVLIFKQSLNFEHHIVYTINKDEFHDFKIPTINNAKSQRVFYYSQNWNFYYTVNKLSKFITGKNDIIVANDWLELGMVSNLGLSNPVIQILHGDFDHYYDLAVKHERNIDFYLCVSPTIFKSLTHRVNESKVINRRSPIQNVNESPEPSIIKSQEMKMRTC